MDDRLISLPGRSPILDAAQLAVLRRYGRERDMAAGDVLFADGGEDYDLIVLLPGTADTRCSWRRAGPASSPPATSAAVRSSGWRPPSARDRWPCA